MDLIHKSIYLQLLYEVAKYLKEKNKLPTKILISTHEKKSIFGNTEQIFGLSIIGNDHVPVGKMLLTDIKGATK
jgi:hypothetical protein